MALTRGRPGGAAAAPAELDAEALRAALGAGTMWLERNAAAVNALNVFPVPDGDTGTNMVLTMRSALAAASQAKAAAAGEVMRAAAQGALMGARGNSGVILSQILAGIATGLAGRAACDGQTLAHAFAEGAASAYRAVPCPVEGTILTVARAAGEAAVAAAADQAGEPLDCRLVVERALAAAKEAVDRTPEQLALLRQAGVVDAGGEGYRLILEGMALALRGEALPEAPAVHVPGDLALPPALKVDTTALPEQEWGYCTQFVIRAQNLDLAQIRAELQALAESTLVVGDETLVLVHGHTGDPGQLLSHAVRFGRLQRISIEDMDAQHDDWLRHQMAETAEAASGGNGVRGASDGGSRAAPPSACDLATIAVVPGEGLAEVFRSLGVAAVVPGGQSMNPSAHEILEAARRTRAQTVIVLPNNANVLSTAEHAARLVGDAGPRLRVVPTTTVPQGIAAQLAFDPQRTPEPNVAAMAAAAGRVRTVEITRATRAVVLDGVAVRRGDVLALLDGMLAAAAGDPLTAAQQALERAGADTAEVLTVYRGQAVAPQHAAAFVAGLRAAHPAAEIECVAGGQPHYDYIISVE